MLLQPYCEIADVCCRRALGLALSNVCFWLWFVSEPIYSRKGLQSILRHQDVQFCQFFPFLSYCSDILTVFICRHLLLCCSPQFGAVWWQLKWFLSITKCRLSHCWLFQVWCECGKTKEKVEGRREDFKLNKDYIDGTSLSEHGLKALRCKGWADG